ncbi:MAG: tetratricopeptide repeat protein [Planctomycetes bacterium]|nr:tetratricopeptide repeat protein [Planctomycetota bacterium]
MGNKSNKKGKGEKDMRFWIVFVAVPITILLCLTIAAFGGYVKNKSTGKQDFETALMYADRNRHTEAIEAFKKELVKDPEDARIYYHMGISYLKLKEYDNASAQLLTALKIKPDYEEAHYQLAIIKLSNAFELRKIGSNESLVLEKLLEAEDICSEIIVENPELPHVHSLLGEIHFEQGLVEDALIDYKNALKLDDSTLGAHIGIIKILLSEKKFVLAQEQCKRALSDKNSENYQALILLSTCYEQQGKNEEAIKVLKQVIEKRPEDIGAHVRLSILYLRASGFDDAWSEAEILSKISPAEALPPVVYFVRGYVLLYRKDYKSAVVQLTEAAARMPRMAHSHYVLASALVETGKLEQAKTEYSTAINLAPEFIDAQLGLAVLQLRERKYSEAIQLGKDILRTDPENIAAMQIMGTAYLKNKDYEAAERQFKELSGLDPSVGDLCMATLSLESGQFSKCIKQCEGIIRLKPDDARIYEILGFAHARRGEFDKGIEQFVKAIELDRNLYSAYLNLANTYIAAGKNTDAINTLKQLISLRPRNFNARVVLGNLLSSQGDIDGAVRVFEKVLEIKPGYIPGYRLASLYLLKGMFGNAKTIFNRALKLGIENAVLYTGFAFAYQHDEKFQAAVLYSQKAIKLKPQVPYFRLMLINLYAAHGKVDKAREQLEAVTSINDEERKEYLGLINLFQGDPEKGRLMALGLNKAFVSILNGFNVLAVKELRKASEIFPDNLIPRLFLASTFISSGQNEEAINIYNEIMENNPEFKSSYDGLGKAYLLSEKRDEAISTYRDLVKMDSDSVAARLTLASLLAKQGLIDEASKVVSEAVELDPNNLSAHNLLGEINLASEKFGEAETEFKKMIESDRKLSVGYRNMVRLEYEKGNYDKCIEYCRKGLKTSPSDILFHQFLGMSYMAKNMLDKAVTEFNKILDINSDYVPAYLSLARIYLGKKQFEVAERLFKMVLKIKPDDANALMGLGNTYALMGRHQEAIDKYNKVAGSKPGDVSVRLQLAMSYSASGNDDMAEDAIKKALELDPENTSALTLLAYAYVKKEKIPEAIGLLKSLLLKNPKNPDAYGLGILFVDVGEFDSSASVYGQGVENFPDNPTLQCNLAVAHLMRGDNESAVSACQRAVKIQPGGIMPNLCMINTYLVTGDFEKARQILEGLAFDKEQKDNYMGLIDFCRLDKESGSKVARHLCLALVYGNAKWYKRALREYDEIIKLVPANTLAYHFKSDILLKTGEVEDAINASKTIIELEPDSITAHQRLAGIYKAEGRVDEEELLREIIEIDSNNLLASFNLATKLQSRSADKEAIALYSV